jgi:phosphatidylinositol kinase/protein kinase (PI-3  family)
MWYFHFTDQLIEELPPYMFLTAFSQLVSRICHPHPDVFKHLKTIIVYMLLVYPQQSLWMLMPVYKVCLPAAAEAIFVSCELSHLAWKDGNMITRRLS